MLGRKVASFLRVQNVSDLLEICSRSLGLYRLDLSTAPLHAVFGTSPTIRNIHLCSSRNAGHAHWQNIKHIKGAKDAERSNLMQQYTLQIRMALKSYENANPKENRELARIIDAAKKDNLSSDRLQKIAQDLLNKKTDLCRYDLKGPAGTFIIVEFLSDAVTRTRGELKAILRKASVLMTMADAGALNFYFDQKGVITTKQPPGSKAIDLDKAEEVAIECGAEEVSETGNPEEVIFICDAMDVTKVSKELEKRNYQIQSAETQYVPKQPIVLPEDFQTEIGKFIAKLQEHPEFASVHTNFEYQLP